MLMFDVMRGPRVTREGLRTREGRGSSKERWSAVRAVQLWQFG